MGGKGKKKGSKSKNGEKGKKNKGGKKPVVHKSGEGKTKSRCNVDIFNEHAMENAYYTCHNIQDVLKIRGFPWPDAQKKKKKGKKK